MVNVVPTYWNTVTLPSTNNGNLWPKQFILRWNNKNSSWFKIWHGIQLFLVIMVTQFSKNLCQKHNIFAINMWRTIHIRVFHIWFFEISMENYNRSLCDLGNTRKYIFWLYFRTASKRSKLTFDSKLMEWVHCGLENETV